MTVRKRSFGFVSAIVATATPHAAGTVAARPAGPRQCWACLQREHASKHARDKPTQCLNSRQPGRLTCHAHRRIDAAARALEASEAPVAISAEPTDRAGSQREA